MDDLTELVAPVDGTVQEVADRSVGSVLREAETLVTLVPDGADLYVEANVSSRDIGYLETGRYGAGEAGKLSVPALRHGHRHALTVISPDSVPLKDGDTDPRKLVYHARVASE